MEQDDVEQVVEEARQRFVAAFPNRYEMLTVLVESASRRDPDALQDLHHSAHRLVGRAGAIQFLQVARHAAALEALTGVEPVAFDPAAVNDCLAELWSAFNAERGASKSSSAAAPQAGQARQTVLIADDDEDQHFLISRLLQRAGFEVVLATEGGQVADLARERRPAAILLDVQMPDQDGFTTARQLKSDPETAFIPLMFLTGRADVDDRLAGLQIGADDYVSKSVDPRELVLRVQKLCARSAAAAERPAAQPWLDRAGFEAQVRARLASTWGTLVLVKGPASEDRVGTFFTEQLRRRDLIGDLEGGQWALFLAEEAASVVGSRMADLLKVLQGSLQKPLAAGLAGSTSPGAALGALLEEADVALAHARSRGQIIVERAIGADEAAEARPKTVLLTDDDPEVTRITDAHVRASGFRTHLAFDGEQAIQAILVLRPDAVVLDLMLPKRTGFDVLAEIQQLPAPRPRVVVLSARGREEDITRAFSLGADDYMIKPFSPQELLARLGRLLR